MYLSHDAPCRLSRLMFTLLVALACAGAPQWAMRSAVAADASPPRNLATAADRLEKVMASVADADQKLPRDTFDVAAVLETTGKDPTAIFHWVRDNTNWIPYYGKLRGPVGVLMDRMGNSQDRALLLAEMLRKSGTTVRLAHAKLDPQLAQQTVAKVRTSAPLVATIAPAASLDNAINTTAGEIGIPAPELHAKVDANMAQVQQLAERVMTRTADQTQSLTDLLSTAGPAPAPPPTTQPAITDPIKLMTDHWWVQQQQGENKWLDLDPTLPDAEPGSALTAAQQAVPLSPLDKPIALPDALQQVITIHVFVEQIQGAARQTKSVLTATLHPADSIGDRVLFMNIPLHWPKDNSIFTADQPGALLRKTVLAQTEYVPMVIIGGSQVSAGSFDVHGNVVDNPNLSGLGVVGQSVVKGAQSAADVFKDFDKPDKKLAATTQQGGTLLAEWLEYEVQIPGQPVQKFRRDVFVQDGFKPGDQASAEPTLTDDQEFQRGLTLLSRVEILDAPCQVSDNYVLHLSTTRLLANKDILPSLLRDPDLPHRKTLSDDFGKLVGPPGPLYDWAVMRSHLSHSKNDLCMTTPMLATYVSRPTLTSAGELVTTAGFDLINVPVTLRPGSHADGVHVQMEQGILDTNLESALAAGDTRSPNTSEMMAVSDAQSVDWAIVSDRQDPKLAASGLSAQALARIDDDLAAGNRVAIPTKPLQISGKPASGWWRINPVTGQTLGMMEDGGGSVMSEYTLLVIIAAGLGALDAGALSFVGCNGLHAPSGAKGMTCIGCAVASAALTAVGIFAVFMAPESALLAMKIGTGLILGGMADLAGCAVGSILPK